MLLAGVALFGLLVSCARAAEPEAGALERYVAQPDDHFGWTQRREGTVGTVSWAELTLTSQAWHDATWKHQLYVLKPSKVRNPSHAVLVIGGGKWNDDLAKKTDDQQLPGQAAAMVGVVEALGSPVAVLLQVPFQPLFDGMVEDQIISYTFAQFLQTGDDSWPLLLPMVKSAVRGMDAVEQFAQRQWSLEIEHFTLTGASKRGWTTWLTSAVDPRVAALAPMVIDTLNMGAQIPHQLASWGRFSEQIHDYTARGLQNFLFASRGRELIGIVDPYQYRERITQPKLIVLGTNDRYWPLDALNLYWKDLPGTKYVLYVPNQGHGIRDPERVLGTVAALHRQTMGELKLAAMSWKFDEEDKQVTLQIEADQKPMSVALWTAAMPTRDFRDAKWTSKPVDAAGEAYTASVELPSTGFLALFGEAVFSTDRAPYHLSTNVRIIAGQ
ncbi:MAG TPA: PhoPQ-activated protein PqaA family protein [Pirellulales bacterium]|jgi:PhoPQ-activated pathogenicity-related protein|nr:PhoPQ-activated protein PqaA family protein [Pirellulales bacterium]